MIEMLTLAYFSRKVKSIAEEQNISAKKWLWRLFLTWFGVEILTIIVVIFSLENTSKDSFIIASLVGVILAIISAFYTTSLMRKE